MNQRQKIFSFASLTLAALGTLILERTMGIDFSGQKLAVSWGEREGVQRRNSGKNPSSI